jgi:hypothetical protein
MPVEGAGAAVPALVAEGCEERAPAVDLPDRDGAPDDLPGFACATNPANPPTSARLATMIQRRNLPSSASAASRLVTGDARCGVGLPSMTRSSAPNLRRGCAEDEKALTEHQGLAGA